MYFFSKVLLLVIGCIVVGLVLLYIFQERLIFFPQPVSQERIRDLKKVRNVGEISFLTKDGTRLSGWLVNNSQAGQNRLIIYYGGNGDELSYMVDYAAKLRNCTVALVNYRGYGMSEGSPGEYALYEDALEVFDALSVRPEVDKSGVIVMGRSLGTGVATFVASKRSPAAVVLVSPYDSLESVARDIYPVLPVSLILKHKFDSLSRAASIDKPLLVLIASNDGVIPPALSRKLAGKWGGEVVIREIEGDHNSICSNDNLWQAVDNFINSLSPSR